MDFSASTNQPHKSQFDQNLYKTVKVILSVVLALALLMIGAEVFLLIFAGILVAIFLSSLAKWISNSTPVPYGWSVALACLVLIAAFIVLGQSTAPGISDQLDELSKKIPQSLEKLRSELERYSWSQLLFENTDPDKVMGSSRQVFNRVTGAVSGFLGGLASFGIILFIGLYGAAEPSTYKRGFLHLIPLPRRERVGHVLDEISETLKWWLIGKFISMAIIGVLTTLGLWLMDVPLAFILGIIATLLTFIPNIGPILSAVPAVLLGLTDSPAQALYITLLYIGIQVVESYILTPLIQRKTVSLPPGLTLGAQVLLGVAFGMLGVALATPLTAAAFVATKRLYVEDTLGDHFSKKSEKGNS